MSRRHQANYSTHVLSHNVKTPMQYSAIFIAVKKLGEGGGGWLVAKLGEGAVVNQELKLL